MDPEIFFFLHLLNYPTSFCAFTLMSGTFAIHKAALSRWAGSEMRNTW